MRNPIVVFVAVAYGLSIASGIAVGLTGGPQSELTGLGLAAMFFPAVAVLIVRLTLREKVASMGWGRFPLRYLPVALLLIPLAMHLVMLPLVSGLEGGLPWQEWLSPDADGLYHAPESRGWGMLSASGLAQRIALNAGVGLIILSCLAFFEEIGWRAWLLPRLVALWGPRRAVLAGAAIWAFWHTPFALSGIHHLEDVPMYLTALILPVGHLGAGMIFGWLWLRTESIWMVCIAHGALNNWGQYAFKYMQDFGGHDALLLGAGMATLFVVGAVLLTLSGTAERAPAPSH